MGERALRHIYASVLLDAGESIKALSKYLGHHDPGFTLRTYTHLMPSSEKRTGVGGRLCLCCPPNFRCEPPDGPSTELGLRTRMAR